MMYCADILGKAWSRDLTSRLYVAGNAIDFVVLFCDIGEHVPLNTGTMDFNSSRGSSIFVDYLMMLSVTYGTVVSKDYMKLSYQLQSM